ncbi:DUF421 domain-containing protein [Solibacillus sp. FSL W7-1324]|uniref:DUF421 domain-containing protein n=1 Tax=Solibacillus sp. FSL W7-1324 TaxID=2921701 RepID=UPI0030FAAF65
MITAISIKIIAGFIALMVVIRFIGKKELTEVTPFDFIFIVILGGTLEEGVYDEKVKVWDVLYTIGLWTALYLLTDFLVRKFERLRPIIKGEPAFLVNNGRLDIKELEKNKMESEQLRSLLRMQGVFSVSEVKYALLEPGGQISVLKKDSPDENTGGVLTHLLIDEGQIEERILAQIGKDKEWIIQRLKEEGHGDIKKIYYAEWSEENGFYIQTYE